MILNVEKIVNKLKVKVDPKVQECLDFVKLQRKICNDVGYKGYSNTPYKVGSLFKYDDKDNEYFLILSITGHKTDIKEIGYYHGMVIGLNETTNTWESQATKLRHSLNDISRGGKVLVSTEGDKHLEEEVFADKHNITDMISKVTKEVVSQMEEGLKQFEKRYSLGGK